MESILLNEYFEKYESFVEEVEGDPHLLENIYHPQPDYAAIVENISHHGDKNE